MNIQRKCGRFYMGNNIHYFYVLECSDGSFYAGYTTHLERRIREHNTGKGAKYTRGRRPVVLHHVKAFSTKSEALREEFYFKKLTRKQKEQYLARERKKEHVATKKL
jgi:putative endonuclease